MNLENKSALLFKIAKIPSAVFYMLSNRREHCVLEVVNHSIDLIRCIKRIFDISIACSMGELISDFEQNVYHANDSFGKTPLWQLENDDCLGVKFYTY